MTDCKIFVDSPFNGLSSLASFIDDLRTETMVQQGWEKLASMRTKDGKTVQLLVRFNSINEDETNEEKSKRTPEEYNLAKNTYIVVWQSLSSALKREMKAHREEIGCDGPSFLWYLFKYYHSTAEHTVHTTLAKMNNLLLTIKHYKGDIDKFATYVIVLLLRFSRTGGTDAQAFDKVYTILINTSCTVFNSEIVVYKQVNASNFDVNKLLIKAREEYRTLLTNKTCTKNFHHTNTKHRNARRKQQPTNIAALVASTSQDNEITKLSRGEIQNMS